MDAIVAERMSEELKGKTLDGWKLEEVLGAGKSAIVFRATKVNEQAAVKIFDREMVKRLGVESQRERIRREKELVGVEHPNLIRILGAGECKELNALFVVMELFCGTNLSHELGKIPMHQVRSILAQLAGAAKFLESKNFAHRDIKPENIGITFDYTHTILFDLGVIRPIGLGNVTDHKEQKYFVGTLQYSAPEFLFRDEEDSVSGWRAITFYQLGAVLHDLLVGKPIFWEYLEPYARLVKAVETVEPKILAPSAPVDLVHLAQNCLQKSPALRLELVNWNSFETRENDSDDSNIVKLRIQNRIHANRPVNSKTKSSSRSRKETKRVAEEISKATQKLLASNREIFPPYEIVPHEEKDHLCLRLDFSKSQAHALALNWRVILDVNIFEAAQTSIRVSGITLSDPSMADCSLSTKGPTEEIFGGVFLEQYYSQRLREYLIRSMDRIQHCSNSNERGMLDV